VADARRQHKRVLTKNLFAIWLQPCFTRFKRDAVPSRCRWILLCSLFLLKHLLGSGLSTLQVYVQLAKLLGLSMLVTRPGRDPIVNVVARRRGPKNRGAGAPGQFFARSEQDTVLSSLLRRVGILSGTPVDESKRDSIPSNLSRQAGLQ
jgi:hypothetical protein